MSNSLATNDDDAYKSGAWTSRRLDGLRQHSSVDAEQHPSSEYPPYRHQQHRDSNEYASIWEPWPPTLPDSQDSSRRAGNVDRLRFIFFGTFSVEMSPVQLSQPHRAVSRPLVGMDTRNPEFSQQCCLHDGRHNFL